MIKKSKKMVLISFLAFTALTFTGCGEEPQPSIADGVKGSFKVVNGMTMLDVKNIMQIEPTGVEKIGDVVIYRYEGNSYKGSGDDEQTTYNNVIIKFKDGKVTHSGTFSCIVPKLRDED